MENLIKVIYRSLNFKSPLILCISGGKDSVAMFHLVMKFRDSFSMLPEVIHFNHGLRAESKEDEEFVKNLSRTFNIHCSVFNLDVKKSAAENNFSIEEAAHLLRYEKLDIYTSQKSPWGYIFTAHTASDQAETIIFRMISGTGRHGLQGIRRKLKLPGGWVVRRPLLDITRDAINSYLEKENIPYCTDKSNLDLKIPRNFIRHRIIKDMKKLNPSLDKNIIRQTDMWVEEEKFLNREIEKKIKNIEVKKKTGKVYVEINEILSYNTWIVRRILRHLSPVDMNYEQTDALCRLLLSEGASHYIELGSSWRARKEYDKLIFEEETPRVDDFEYPIIIGKEIYIKEIKKKFYSSVFIKKRNSTKLKGDGVNIRKVVSDEEVENMKKILTPSPLNNVVFFDAEKINTRNLKVRGRKPGDRIRLWGLNGTKKIKDLVMDMKLPLDERSRIALIVEGKKILWMAPYRRSDIAPLGAKTSKILKMEIND